MLKLTKIISVKKLTSRRNVCQDVCLYVCFIPYDCVFKGGERKPVSCLCMAFVILLNW